MKWSLFIGSFLTALAAQGMTLSNWIFTKTSPDDPQAEWKQVTVPHCWNAQDAQKGGGKENNKDFGYYRGPGTYRIKLPDTARFDGKRVFVRFGAVSNFAEVYLNGEKLAEHKGAFTSFGTELTGKLKPGAGNVLEVRADNSLRREILPISGDFPVYGGMYRNVELIERDPVCISPIANGTDGVRITQHNVSNESADLGVSVTVDSALPDGGEGTLEIALYDAQGKSILKASKPIRLTPGESEHQVDMTVPSPHLWQGREDPYLYKLDVRLSSGDNSTLLSYPIGFRSVSFDPDKGFSLNGKALKIKGVCRHQDWEGKGWALTEKEHRRDLDLILEMGANAIRLAHYPHDPKLIAMCDAEGVILWEEIPFVDSVGKPKDPAVEETTKQQLVEMIRQLGNHSSIVVWGLSNELLHRSTDDPLPLLRELNVLAHKEDPYRKTVVAVNRPGNKDLCSIADLLALNTYPGWYGGGPEGMGGAIDSLHKSYPNTPVAISEYGSGASIKHHDRNISKAPKAGGKWHPEEWQSRSHEILWDKIASRETTWGTFLWNMFDFASVWRDEGDRPGINDKGLVTFDRKVPKDAFYFYKANWRDDIPVLHLQEKRATPTSDEKVAIRFYSNMKNNKVFLNEKEVPGVSSYCRNGFATPPVALKRGRNVVKVISKDDKGQLHRDEAEWIYQPDSKGNNDGDVKK